MLFGSSLCLRGSYGYGPSSSPLSPLTPHNPQLQIIKLIIKLNYENKIIPQLPKFYEILRCASSGTFCPQNLPESTIKNSLICVIPPPPPLPILPPVPLYPHTPPHMWDIVRQGLRRDGLCFFAPRCPVTSDADMRIGVGHHQDPTNFRLPSKLFIDMNVSNTQVHLYCYGCGYGYDCYDLRKGRSASSCWTWRTDLWT